MFEKEAEEYAGNREVCDLLDAISEDLQNYDYGTVAHYNIDPLVEECFKDGAEFGYNKANEWHYVKDGLPSEDDVYLIYTTKGVLLGHYEQGGADGETNFKGEPYSDFTEYPSEMLFTEDDVIAWKEIVLPELKESE